MTEMKRSGRNWMGNKVLAHEIAEIREGIGCGRVREWFKDRNDPQCMVLTGGVRDGKGGIF